MSKLLLVIAVTTLLSTPALANRDTELALNASVQSHAELGGRGTAPRIRVSQTSQPHREPCPFWRRTDNCADLE
jgi:uncharacterized protein YdeI (BOF family)